MSKTTKLQYLTIEEYMANEARSSVKHEYVDGQVFAMSGVTRRHNIIAGNIYGILRAHLRGSQCRAYIADVKTRVKATNSFYYPDVMVSCDSYDRKTVYSDNPVLLVEVLSRSTAAIDRREKMIAYRQIPSLKEYMVVYQSRQKVELHRRNEQVPTEWEILEYQNNQELELVSIQGEPMKLLMSAIYEDADFGPQTDLHVREQVFDQYGGDDDTLEW